MIKAAVMCARRLWFPLFLVIFASQALPKSKTVKEQMEFNGRKRAYYLFVPEMLDPSKPASLLIALHGARAYGKTVIVEWEAMAIKKGFILVAPNALDIWFLPPDSPNFLYALVESIKSRFNIDSRRVYLFGHSAGGIHAAVTAVLEPEYFAAVAVHGGYLPAKVFSQSNSRIPIGFWIGDLDTSISVDAVRATANFLKDIGFPVRITVIEGSDHDYGGIARLINEDIWSFLGSKALTRDPHWINIDKQLPHP